MKQQHPQSINSQTAQTPSTQVLKRLLTMTSRKKMWRHVQLTFPQFENSFVFSPLGVIAVQFISGQRTLKMESSARQRHGELQSADLHVAEVAR